MDVLALTHLCNILYREDTIKDRTRLVYKWMKEDERMTLVAFDKLLEHCTEEQLQRDLDRRNKEEKESFEFRILVQLKSKKEVDEIKAAITKGIYRGLDTEPTYIAAPKDVEIDIELQ